jgi:hypothetical protein
VARAVKVVVALAVAVAVMLKVPEAVAVPDATAVPPQLAAAKICTVLLASAVPESAGVVDVRDGDTGFDAVIAGAAGAVLSCV